MLELLKRKFWVKGAISFEKDDKIEIEKRTIQFIESFLKLNKIKDKDIILMMIIAPAELHSAYPCTFIRKKGFKFPCMTFSDINVYGSPQNILRFIVHCKSYKRVKDLYLEEALKLKEILDKNLNLNT